jgi:DNA phosphorothioation-associated putative methyltransferase
MERLSKTRGVRRASRDAFERVLRVYEGCARALLGAVEGANVIKLHRRSGKVTYLACPGLDRDPDPALELRVKVTLPTLSIDIFDYSGREDPPRLAVEPRLLRSSRESGFRDRA